MNARGRLVRECTSFGLSGHIRASPRHAEQNDRLLRGFSEASPVAARLSGPRARKALR